MLLEWLLSLEKLYRFAIRHWFLLQCEIRQNAVKFLTVKLSLLCKQTFPVITEHSQQFGCIMFCECTFNAHVSQRTSCLNNSSRSHIDTLICYLAFIPCIQTSIWINLSFVKALYFLPMWNRSCFFHHYWPLSIVSKLTVCSAAQFVSISSLIKPIHFWKQY